MTTKKRHSLKTPEQFRQHIENLTEEARAAAGPEVDDFAANLIELLSVAYERGGLAESRRAFAQVKAHIK